jgi:integral membrane sensor domain MASE1
MTQPKAGQMVFVIVALFALFGISNNVSRHAQDGEDRSEHIIALVMIGGVSTAGLLKSMIDESKSSITKKFPASVD